MFEAQLTGGIRRLLSTGAGRWRDYPTLDGVLKPLHVCSHRNNLQNDRRYCGQHLTRIHLDLIDIADYFWDTIEYIDDRLADKGKA